MLKKEKKTTKKFEIFLRKRKDIKENSSYELVKNDVETHSKFMKIPFEKRLEIFDIVIKTLDKEVNCFLFRFMKLLLNQDKSKKRKKRRSPRKIRKINFLMIN